MCFLDTVRGLLAIVPVRLKHVGKVKYVDVTVAVEVAHADFGVFADFLAT